MPGEEVPGSREKSRLFPPPGQCAAIAGISARMGRNSQAWLELKMRELKETVAQVSDAKGNIVQAVSEVLEDHGVQEEKREEILRLAQAAIEKALDDSIQMRDWALEALGATIDEKRTSKSYGGQGKKTWWLFPFAFSSANPPETILQGADEATAETLLGTFTYDVHKEIAQTFHVQKELPRTFRYITLRVHSNWGNPEYTCVYRVQVHGKTASRNDRPQAQELL
ncbi:SUN domain-containing protein 3-like [Grus japonensis]|uniref:SUN domain-containing protein 3-like n=1 Tax=Grus japonensis TaxID=30415 RepID=A0ABC9XQF8_GRUJA